MRRCGINLKMPIDLCKRFCGLCVFLWLFTVTVEAQTGSVTLKATVSETVALSVAPSSIEGDVDANVLNSGSTVRMTFSGNSATSPVIRVPLIVRSNSSFRISASFESNTAQLAQLSVVDVRAMGRLVSTEAVKNLEIPEHLDLEGLSSFLVASGPRVSVGGTLQSPNNALQITLLVRVNTQPQPGSNWLASLTLFNH